MSTDKLYEFQTQDGTGTADIAAETLSAKLFSGAEERLGRCPA
jgi:hypothetical protein